MLCHWCMLMLDICVDAMQQGAMEHRLQRAFPVTYITCTAQATCIHPDMASHMQLSWSHAIAVAQLCVLLCFEAATVTWIQSNQHHTAETVQAVPVHSVAQLPVQLLHAQKPVATFTKENSGMAALEHRAWLRPQTSHTEQPTACQHHYPETRH